MAYSPMIKQYFTIKDKYKDCILLYRLGDFYEMFFDDAVKASKILDLVLTARDCGDGKRAPMCGVPYHAVENYIMKLVNSGCNVAICEQGEQANKKMMDRNVVRVITPGTVIEDNILDEKANNFLLALYLGKKTAAFCWGDVSTGELLTAEIPLTADYSTLQEKLSAISPVEILCPADALFLNEKLNCFIGNFIPKMKAYYDSAFDFPEARKILLGHYKVASEKVLGLEEHPECVSAAGALLSYLYETQLRELPHIEKIEYVSENEYMSLDFNTRKNLELVASGREQKKKGSLLWLLDRTETSMGARKLKSWISRPLSNKKAISARLGYVEVFVDNFLLREGLCEALSNVRDIDRLCGKAAYGTVTPKDLLALKFSLGTVPRIKKIIETEGKDRLYELNKNIDPLSELYVLLDNSIDENAPALLKDGEYIKRGYDEELDKLYEIKHGSVTLLKEIEERERNRTGIKNLKVAYNKVFGYYIEISNSFKSMVPQGYIRKQTLTTGERYITEELKILEEKLLSADEKFGAREKAVFDNIRKQVIKNIARLQSLSNILSSLDAILSMSRVSVKNGYVKPEITDSDELIIKNGRHPVIEEYITEGSFISNDTYLDAGKNRTIILTGPNMSGKSTYMRQIALITVMAHIGCFVPADAAVIPVTNKIFTRIGASDDILLNQSTFMVEMIESAFIIKNATKKSLIIIDELGRGTSTQDGLSIAQAIIEYINEKIRAKTVFATHFSELISLEKDTEGINNYRVAVSENENGIVFLHKIERGGASKSFGIEVAELAGIDKAIINRAKELTSGNK